MFDKILNTLLIPIISNADSTNLSFKKAFPKIVNRSLLNKIWLLSCFQEFCQVVQTCAKGTKGNFSSNSIRKCYFTKTALALLTLPKISFTLVNYIIQKIYTPDPAIPAPTVLEAFQHMLWVLRWPPSSSSSASLPPLGSTTSQPCPTVE